MPKDKVNGNRLTIEYDETDPKEALEVKKKQLNGKLLKDLTEDEKDNLIKTLLSLT